MEQAAQADQPENAPTGRKATPQHQHQGDKGHGLKDKAREHQHHQRRADSHHLYQRVTKRCQQAEDKDKQEAYQGTVRNHQRSLWALTAKIKSNLAMRFPA